ncbi:MAG: alkaline phosphatase [Burkholderiales bacterium]
MKTVLERYRRAWLLIAVALVLGIAACSGGGVRPSADGTPRNIIILYADGVAPTQWEFGRYSSQLLRKQPFVTTDVVMREGTLGLLATWPADAMVTDSAASATAMSTGFKTNNYMVGVTPDGKPVETLMEAAKKAGKRIGLVTTATVYDASPAAFSVHAVNRGDAESIVNQYLALAPDVLLGGGAEFFLPAGKGGKRKDGQDVIAAFAARGYAIARNTGELARADAPRVLGLFANDDLGFELGRDAAKEPSTADMARAALRALARDNPNGFVLFVENENTDTAGHQNDAAALMHALWAFDDAVKVALEFQRANPDTLILVTGDHETGGFSPTYAQRDLSTLSSKNRFFAADPSFAMLGGITLPFAGVIEKAGKDPKPEVLDALLAQHYPGFRLDPDLREAIVKRQPLERSQTYIVQGALGRMVARQTAFYWATTGHTSEPVAVGALGPGARAFSGFQDNTEFGKALKRLLATR